MELTIEEMGRTLRYFEWKRDWWLSLTPERTNSDPHPDIRSGLCAYAHRQSDLYDNLITSFVSHWWCYLSAQSLGCSWLDKYASRVRFAPTPSFQQADAHSTPAAAHTPNDVHTPILSGLPVNPQLLVDPPLRSESNNDSDWGEDLNSGGDIDDCINAEDILDED